MTDRAVMQQALRLAQERLELWFDERGLAEDAAAVTAIREALAQPEQEPFAWLYPEGLAALKAGKCWTAYGTKQDDNNIPIYDAVAPRVEPRASESGAGFESLPASPDNQPEQEPVAHVYLFEPNGRPRVAWDNAKDIKIGDKLYTFPPRREWVGLTEEDKAELDEQYGDDTLAHLDAVEAKLREKNNG